MARVSTDVHYDTADQLGAKVFTLSNDTLALKLGVRLSWTNAGLDNEVTLFATRAQLLALSDSIREVLDSLTVCDTCEQPKDKYEKWHKMADSVICDNCHDELLYLASDVERA